MISPKFGIGLNRAALAGFNARRKEESELHPDLG